ncbi:hypothetical protein HPB51_008710 [Rhipicephalus microplus]|uniref:Uncharacterized protein n=1 Tax=Rhipicephalus microplus TaxID=6941 RepID=A0A9J6EZA7_RHIMP|nr:hypothetical protein HPB51_008710 [Rhipicephalus microplus]
MLGRAVESMKPAEHERAEKLEREVEEPIRESLVGVVPEVQSKKPTRQEDNEKLQLEVDISAAAEAAVSELSDFKPFKPTEHEGVEKRPQENERPLEESHEKAVHDVDQRTPTEFVDIERLEPVTFTAAEENSTGAVTESEQRKPRSHEDIEMLKLEIEGPPMEAPLSAVREHKTKIEHEGAEEILKAKAEKPHEETGQNLVPQVLHQTPTEQDGVEKLKPVIQRPADKTTMLYGVEPNKDAEYEVYEGVKYDYGSPLEETLVGAAPDAMLTESAEFEPVEKLDQDITASAVPDIEQKKPTDLSGVELEPYIEVPLEQTNLSAGLGAEQKEYAEREGVKKMKSIVDTATSRGSCEWCASR